LATIDYGSGHLRRREHSPAATGVTRSTTVSPWSVPPSEPRSARRGEPVDERTVQRLSRGRARRSTLHRVRPQSESTGAALRPRSHTCVWW